MKMAILYPNPHLSPFISMGLYDTIAVPCPKCGELYPAQSKSGACEMKDYELDKAPSDVLADVNRHAPFECECGAVFEVLEGKPVECPMRKRKDHLGINEIIENLT